MAPRTKTAPPPVKVIVKRGALRRFDRLKAKSAEVPIEVIWDRRLGDRRAASSPAGPDRRKTDRRQPPPFTWDVSGFVVAAKPRKKTSKG